MSRSRSVSPHNQPADCPPHRTPATSAATPSHSYNSSKPESSAEPGVEFIDLLQVIRHIAPRIRVKQVRKPQLHRLTVIVNEEGSMVSRVKPEHTPVRNPAGAVVSAN